MVHFATTLVGAAALAVRFASAAPRPQDGLGDSALGQEVAVSAPDGIPLTDTAELLRQSIAEAGTATPIVNAAWTTPAAAEYTPAYSSPAAAYEYSSPAAVYSSPAAYSSPEYVAPPAYTSSPEYVASQVYSTSEWTTSTAAAAEYTTSTTEHVTTSVYTPPSYTTTAYGSGSTSWNNGGYDNCVQQCIASFGAPPAAYTPTAASGYEAGSVGTGATHTVIVAPTQGVLRYVPFAVNASVGDTVKFVWGANVHTVTKSDTLSICNATLDAPFASGRQNKSFVFTQVVNTTDPVFFHCAVPTHCQKGMFGIINPPNALVAPASVANVMPDLVKNNSDVAAYAAYTNQKTAGNKVASNWGGSIDTTGWPDWSVPIVAENVMYSRTFLAANPDVIKDDGSIDLGATGDKPLLIPEDLSVALSANTQSTAGAPSGAATESTAAPTGTSAAANGARGLASSGAVAGIVALMAAIFAL